MISPIAEEVNSTDGHDYFPKAMICLAFSCRGDG
jgi:hypothetical protein